MTDINFEQMLADPTRDFGPVAARLCDEDGTVRRGLFHHGTDYACTGSAHHRGARIMCDNPIHINPPNWHQSSPDATEAQDTPVSTPSGPSAGLEGAAQRRVERYAEAMAEADGGPDLGCFSEDYIDHARAAIAVADQELAEKDATIAELRAEVDAMRERYNDARAALRNMDRLLTEVDATDRQMIFADVAALMNDRAQMWEDDNRPVLARESRDLANAFRTYAEGVGVPSMETLRKKRRAAEAERDALRAEVERLRKPTVAAVMGYELGAGDLEHAEARVAELEATVAKVRALAREAAEAIVSGHSHWDSTMRYGAGCDTCQSQRDERDRLLAILDAPKDTTAP